MARLPKSIIKKYGITKKAWSVFRGRRKSRPKKVKTKRRSVRKLVRRYRRKRRGGGGKSLTRTVFKWVRIGALVAPGAARVMQHGFTEQAVVDAIHDYTGYHIKHRNFDLSRLMIGWGPYLGACLATYGIPKIVSIMRRL